MVEAATQALQRQGVAGMSFTDVLRDSNAARGAIYHHFPGGKLELVAEAGRRNGAEVAERLGQLEGSTPVAVVTAFLDAVRPVLLASTTGGGCAVAALALGDTGLTSRDIDLREVAETAFAEWARVLAVRLTGAGLARAEAANLAVTLITVLEGAHVLCRAQASIEPFDQVRRTLTSLVSRAR
jgi:TetR/AcrR family transcriptional regulator, lmrAB and yxaGH operons repressor